MPNDVDFSHVPFSAQNVGPNVGEIPQSELDSFQNFMSDEIEVEKVIERLQYSSVKLAHESQAFIQENASRSITHLLTTNNKIHHGNFCDFFYCFVFFVVYH